MTEEGRRLRIFAGVPLDEAAAGPISRAIARFPGRGIPPLNWHLTLCFLGSVAEETGLRVVSRLSGLGAPFEVELDRFGAFPSPEHARIFWLGSSRPEPRLAEVAARVREAAAAEGIETDARPFVAHVTLGKLERARDLRDYLSARPPVSVTVPVDRVVFFESRLAKGPPVYAEWRSLPLR